MMIKKSLLALGVGAVLVTGAVQAQMQHGPMSGQEHPMHGQGHEQGKGHNERSAKSHQQHMTKLKQSLKLGADQTTAWTAFETAMQMPPMERPDHKAMASMTTPERLDVMNKMKNQHDAQMQKRQDATRTFYASLNPEQKKIFDSETAHASHQQDRHGKNKPHGH